MHEVIDNFLTEEKSRSRTKNRSHRIYRRFGVEAKIMPKYCQNRKMNRNLNEMYGFIYKAYQNIWEMVRK